MIILVSTISIVNAKISATYSGNRPDSPIDGFIENHSQTHFPYFEISQTAFLVSFMIMLSSTKSFMTAKISATHLYFPLIEPSGKSLPDWRFVN